MLTYKTEQEKPFLRIALPDSSAWVSQMKENQCNFVFICDRCDAVFAENRLLIEHKGTHVQHGEGTKLDIKNEAKMYKEANESQKKENFRIGECEISKFDTTAEREIDKHCAVSDTEERYSDSENAHFSNSKRNGHFTTNSEMKRNKKSQRRVELLKNHKGQLQKESSAKQHLKSASKSHRCSECGKKFSNEAKLQKHLALLDKNLQEGSSEDCTNDERGGKSFWCSDCDGNFDNKCQFQAHLNMRKEWMLFQCSHCNRFFSLQHCNMKDQMCPLCGKNASNLVDFRTSVMNLAKQKSYQCEVCDKSFDIKSELIRHAWRHADRKQHKCQQCDKSFADKRKLRDHARTHAGEKPYQCSVCERTFAQKLGLDIHARTHTGKKPFQCTNCERSFADQSNLRNHLRSHTGERTHECAECGKVFGTGFRLKRHMRIHTGEKPYQCSECGKAFTNSENLRVHMIVHTGERKHKCPVCDKTFAQKSALNTHKLTHTGEKPHECIQCGKRFVQRAHLKKHLKFSCPSTKHRDAEIFSCYVCHVLFTDPTREGGNSGVPKREMCMKCCDALRRGETLGNLRESSKTRQPSSELLKTSFTAETSPAIRAQMKVGKGKSNQSGIPSRIQSRLSGTSEDDVNGDGENNLYETENMLDNFKGRRLDMQTPNRDNHKGRFKSDERAHRKPRR